MYDYRSFRSLLFEDIKRNPKGPVPLINYTVFWVDIVELYPFLSFPFLFLLFCHYSRFCLEDIVSNQHPCCISVASGVR